MEVCIGIKQAARELTFETEASADELSALIQNGETGLVSLTDNKGRQFLVNRESIAYVELGSDTARKVGFVG